MATLIRIRSMLLEHRRDLLGQLDAIARAIAALDGAREAAGDVPPVDSGAGVTPAEAGVVPRRIAPRRVQSDSHKQAVAAGKREARQARDAAKGLARDVLGDSFVPAIGSRGERQQPRLVRRSVEKKTVG